MGVVDDQDPDLAGEGLGQPAGQAAQGPLGPAAQRSAAVAGEHPHERDRDLEAGRELADQSGLARAHRAMDHGHRRDGELIAQRAELGRPAEERRRRDRAHPRQPAGGAARTVAGVSAAVWFESVFELRRRMYNSSEGSLSGVSS